MQEIKRLSFDGGTYGFVSMSTIEPRCRAQESIFPFPAKDSFRDGKGYAVSGEVCEYEVAVRRLPVSADGFILYNPSTADVWTGVDKRPVKISSGKAVTL